MIIKSKWSKFIVFPILILLANSLKHASASIETETWSSIALNDLYFLHKTTLENHPGPVDENNPYFTRRLKTNFAESEKQAKAAKSLNDVLNVLRFYVAGFADGHFNLDLNYAQKRHRWPGLTLEKVGAKYVVKYRAEEWASTLPPVDSQLLSCDGRTAERILIQDVLPYTFNDENLNFPKELYAHEIFIHRGLGNKKELKNCLFITGSKAQPFELRWESIDTLELKEKYKARKKTKNFSASTIDSGVTWVTIPTFAPDEDQIKQLSALMSTLAALKTSDSVIIDLTGNRGGNSQWGENIAHALLKDNYSVITNSKSRSDQKIYAEWRVSDGNLNYLKKELLPSIEKQFGKSSAMYSSFEAVTNEMEKALETETLFVVQKGKNETPSKRQPPSLTQSSIVPKIKSPKILLLTDSKCASACLDFMDTMLKAPNVTHVGHETAADSVYIDIRRVNLPSGLASITLPQKVYRNRERKHNQSYFPKYYYDGSMSNTESLRKWVLGFIKK